jgi:hypothetical protein
MNHEFLCADFFSPERYSRPSESEGESCEQTQDRQDGHRQSEKLEDCDNIFYKCVTEMNHLCVKEQVSDIIANILEHHEHDSM